MAYYNGCNDLLFLLRYIPINYKKVDRINERVLSSQQSFIEILNLLVEPTKKVIHLVTSYW